MEIHPFKSTNIETVVKAAAIRNPNLYPEWLRVNEAVRISGMCRSSLYVELASGKIKSFSKRQRGAVRGIRLISYDSLMAYLEQAYQDAMKGGL